MDDIRVLIENQRKYFNSGVTMDTSFRINQLKILKKAIIDNEEKILNALKEDLNKSPFEAYETEIGVVLHEISHVAANLHRWVMPSKVRTPLMNFPSKSYIYSEPYGTALVMAPWNYPFQLAIAPLIGSISAGNCTVIKPSEYSTKTTEVLCSLIRDNFDPRYIAVIEGGREINSLILEEKFDFIFFTGSVAVGKIVMGAAAKYLTPVVLELGGKSPCIVDKNVDIERAAKRIAWGKFLNAGQTCVAPDYVYVHRDIKDDFIKSMRKHILSFYGDNPKNSNDYPRIINERHHKRLVKLLDEDKIIEGGEYDEKKLYISPTIMEGVTWEDPVMDDEIFGPILPLIEYEKLEEVINTVNSHPKPLALYVFSKNNAVIDRVLKSVSFGGGCVNDTIMHLSTPYLPFGGVGESGTGGYHGKASFEAFSHKKSILKRPFSFEMEFRYPPYGDKIGFLRKVLK